MPIPSSLRRFVAASLLLLLLPFPLRAAEQTHLIILHINDAHGHTQPWINKIGQSVGGYARVKTIVDSIRQKEGADRVLVFHAGDEISRGDALTSSTRGSGNIAILNEIGLSAFTPGNGEFYPGAANLQKLIAEAKFPTLASNLRYRLNDEAFAENSLVLTAAGVRVGILGLCYIHAEHPSSWVLKREAPLDTAKRIVPDLRQRADVVIALNHIGIDEDRRLATAIPGIDLIVGGHSHTVLREGERITGPGGKPVLLVQAGDFLRYVGRVDLQLERKGTAWTIAKSTARLLPVDATTPEDPTIKATLARLWPAGQPTTVPAQPAPVSDADR